MTARHRISQKNQLALLASIEEIPLSPQLLAQQQLHMRAIARRDLTAAVCGDPPPGYSELDRQHGCYVV